MVAPPLDQPLELGALKRSRSFWPSKYGQNEGVEHFPIAKVRARLEA
jgi:hypothetical protein